jgi:hypothetical protein
MWRLTAIRMRMDQFTLRIVGFGMQVGEVDGPALCRISTGQSTVKVGPYPSGT